MLLKNARGGEGEHVHRAFAITPAQRQPDTHARGTILWNINAT